MSKELEALYRLKVYADCCEGDYESNPNEDYKIVEKELKEYEQYRVTEEELGINLLTFVKVLKAPEIYFKRENEILEVPHCDIFWDIAVNSIAIILEEDKNHTLYSIYHLRDSGKTWALTKEELMNE